MAEGYYMLHDVRTASAQSLPLSSSPLTAAVYAEAAATVERLRVRLRALQQTPDHTAKANAAVATAALARRACATSKSSSSNSSVVADVAPAYCFVPVSTAPWYSSAGVTASSSVCSTRLVVDRHKDDDNSASDDTRAHATTEAVAAVAAQDVASAAATRTTRTQTAATRASSAPLARHAPEQPPARTRRVQLQAEQQQQQQRATMTTSAAHTRVSSPLVLLTDTAQEQQQQQQREVMMRSASDARDEAQLRTWLQAMLGLSFVYTAADDSFTLRASALTQSCTTTAAAAARAPRNVDEDSSDALPVIFSDGVVLAYLIRVLERRRCDRLAAVLPTSKPAAKRHNVRCCIDYLQQERGVLFDVPLVDELLLCGDVRGVLSVLRALRATYRLAHRHITRAASN